MSEAELSRILSIAPQSEADEMIQGEAYLSMGRYEEADRSFTRLLQRANGDADRLLVIGDTLKVDGDLMRAKDAYQLALNAEPGNLKAQRGIERINKAQTEADKTLRLAQALNTWRSSSKGSSVDYYEEALSQNPRNPEARLALSKLYEKTRQYGKAAVSYQFYMGLRPDLTEKERQSYIKKIANLQEQARKTELQQQQQPANAQQKPLPSTLTPTVTTTPTAPLQANQAPPRK